MEDSSFSLSHPNQYFLESQKLLGGGRDVKREAEAPQRSQEGSNSATARATQEAAPKAPQGLAEMTEELDSFFQDDWICFFSTHSPIPIFYASNLFNIKEFLHPLQILPSFPALTCNPGARLISSLLVCFSPACFFKLCRPCWDHLQSGGGVQSR